MAATAVVKTKTNVRFHETRFHHVWLGNAGSTHEPETLLKEASLGLVGLHPGTPVSCLLQN